MRTFQLRRIFVVLLAAAGLVQASAQGLLPGAEPPDKDDIERRAVELKALSASLQTLLRSVPSCDPAEEKSQLEVWARKGGELTAFEIRPVAGLERLRLEDGRPTPIELIRLEISGRDPYEKVNDFLARLALRSPLVDPEGLSLQAEAGGTVRYTARFALPCYAEEQSTAPSESTPEAILDNEIARQTGILRMLERLAARSDPGRLAVALGALEREIGNGAVALTAVRSAEEVVLEGVALGASSRNGLEPALKRAGFQEARIQMSPAQECQKFTVTARLGARETSEEREAVIGNGLFDGQTAAFCASPPALGRIVAQGKKDAPEGALSLRLRDVDVVDLFFALHDLTAQGFVIDPDVTGRVSVDVAGATLEEMLAALSSVGLTAGPGPLRRVSRATTRPAAAPPSRASYTGEKIDLLIHGADLPTLLCTFKQISQLQISAPRDLKGTVTIFATDLPWDQMMEGVIAPAGLVSTRDGKSLLLGPASARVRDRANVMDVCEIPTPESTSSRLASRRSLSELGPADLELAGLAQTGDTWKAYAVSPSRQLFSLKAGEQLRDARVKSVGSTGVAFTGDSGAVEMLFRP